MKSVNAKVIGPENAFGPTRNVQLKSMQVNDGHNFVAVKFCFLHNERGNENFDSEFTILANWPMQN